MMMLEAQFGEENIFPIERPRRNSEPEDQQQKHEEGQQETKQEEEEEEGLSADDEAELARLRGLGIPFPGIEIRVDKNVARVWLEDLDVECANGVLRDRVRVVVDRAVETVASMWAEESRAATAIKHNGVTHRITANGAAHEEEEKKLAMKTALVEG